MTNTVRVNFSISNNNENNFAIIVEDESTREDTLRRGFFERYDLIVQRIATGNLSQDRKAQILHYYEQFGVIAILLIDYYLENGKREKVCQIGENIGNIVKGLMLAGIDVKNCPITEELVLIQIFGALDHGIEKLTLTYFNILLSGNYRITEKNTRILRILAATIFPREHIVDVAEELQKLLQDKDVSLWKKFNLLFHVIKIVNGNNDYDIASVASFFYEDMVKYLDENLSSVAEKEKIKFLRYFIKFIKLTDEEGILGEMVVSVSPIKIIQKWIFANNDPLALQILHECNTVLFSLDAKERYKLLSGCVSLLDNCTFSLLAEFSEAANLLVADNNVYYHKLCQIGFFQKILQRVGFDYTSGRIADSSGTISFAEESVAKICFSFANMFEMLSKDNVVFQQMMEVFMEEFMARLHVVNNREFLSIAADLCKTSLDSSLVEGDYVRAMKFFGYYLDINVKFSLTQKEIRMMMAEIVGFLDNFPKKNKHYKNLLLLIEQAMFDVNNVGINTVFQRGCEYTRLLLWRVMLEMMIEKSSEERQQLNEIFNKVFKRAMEENSLEVLSPILVRCISSNNKINSEFALELFEEFFGKANRINSNELNELYKLGLTIYFQMCSAACFKEQPVLAELRVKLMVLINKMQSNNYVMGGSFILFDHMMSNSQSNPAIARLYAAKLIEHSHGHLKKEMLIEVNDILNSEADFRAQLQQLRISLQPVAKDNEHVAGLYLSILCQSLKNLPPNCKEFNNILEEISDIKDQYMCYKLLSNFIEGLLAKKESIAALIQPFHEQKRDGKRHGEDDGNDNIKKPRVEDQPTSYMELS